MARMESPNRTTTASTQLGDDRAERLEAYCDKTGKSKSQVLREGIDAVAGSNNQEYTTPLQPPSDERLAWGYKQLVDNASKDGTIPDDTARRVTSGGRYGLSKHETKRLIIRELHRRGFIRSNSNLYGDRTWKLHGWDR